MTTLNKAIYKGNVARVRNLISTNNKSLNQFDSDGYTPLLRAVTSNKIEIVKLLLAAGANPNIKRNGDGALPIHFAIGRSDIIVMRMLLEAGTDPNAHFSPRFFDGMSLLTYTIGFGNIDKVRLLIQYGATVNTEAFIAAANFGFEDITRLLIQTKPEIITHHLSGKSIINAAVKAKHPRVVRLLVQAGAKVTPAHLNNARGKPNLLNALNARHFVKKVRSVVSHWRGTVKKSNNNWVKAQMSKGPNKVPVSKNKTNLVTWENFNNNNVGIKVTQRWGNVGRRENYLKPKTLQALAGKPWIDPKGKNNVRSMSRLASVFTHPYTRRRVYRRNLSPVVFVKNKSGTINWNAPN
jgi:ankyrin repeat protein